MLSFLPDKVKLFSEKPDQIIPFLKNIKERFGTPLASVHDMGVEILNAVAHVFPDKPDFICHFHYLQRLSALKWLQKRKGKRKRNDDVRKPLLSEGRERARASVRKTQKMFNSKAIVAVGISEVKRKAPPAAKVFGRKENRGLCGEVDMDLL